jgi:hypothetical protein
VVDDSRFRIRARLALKSRNLLAAQSCAAELELLGFDVTSVSEHGVGFEGALGDFETVFASSVILAGEQPRFATRPIPPDRIAEFVESVYFPTRPSFFRVREKTNE